MSLYRHSVRRSMNVALANPSTTAHLRPPALSRALSNNAQFNELHQRKKDKTVIKHAPGWKQEDASESEANVKADREPHPRNVEHLQRETVDHLHGDGDTLLTDMKERAQVIGKNIAKASKEYSDKAQGVGDSLTEEGREYLKVAKNEARHLGEMASKQGPDYAQKAKSRAEKMASQEDGQKWAEQIKDQAENAKLSGEGYVDQAVTQAKEMGDKNRSPESKDYAYKVKEDAKHSGDSVMDGVKTGAQKMGALLKETMETAKKAAGLDK
ncbi:hypothetical protein EMPS_11115 [Entomortierella parvispora]|uniref:Uncharacterized protein n=1 Tax=Entomortierella parvispora TaxID=205924 RepID=A0A9P3HLF9_9FUNG|nr:hypothetical protein EMPS_11115 [Entomortierella parvispora]